MTATTNKKGIDVSHHNGLIDWDKVKKSGIDFAIVRAGYGVGSIDKNAEYNIDNALKSGVDVGIYWFGYAGDVSTAKKEAAFCYNFIKKWSGKLKYPIYYDWEYDSYDYNKRKGIICTKDSVSAMADTFCKTMEGYGYFAGIYTNVDYYNRFFTETVRNRYTLWVAQWASACSIPADIWQYGAEENHIDSKYVNGIKGIVDKNIAYRDFPSIIVSMGLNGFKKSDECSPSEDKNLDECSYKKEYDVNNDGKVSAADALEILNYIKNK